MVYLLFFDSEDRPLVPTKTQNSLNKVRERRSTSLNKILNDPYIGYGSIQEASNDCKGSSQVEVLCRMLNRENLFISGPAGSGKTTIIKRFIDLIDAIYDGVFNIAITATTGLAATNVGGRTIHSWSGLGVMEEPFNLSALRKSGKLMRMSAARTRARYCDVLIIDEISMLHAYYLDNLDAFMKYARRSQEPFGGVQVVFLGDFMQLPPVAPREPLEGLNYGFAIQSKAWMEANIQHCYLDKIHRAEDPELKHLLFCIERERMDDRAIKVIERCKHNGKDSDKVYTTLFTTNRNVDTYNNDRLDENPNPAKNFKTIKLLGSAKDLEALKRDHNIPETVRLKKGATVIVTRNLTTPDGDLLAANGSVGKVETFHNGDVQVRLNDGSVVDVSKQRASISKRKTTKNEDGETITFDEETAAVLYMPLKLGYAITVHKSQGQTLDGIEVDLSRCFSPGLGYVALSRVRNADSMVISKINDDAFRVNPLCKQISTFVKRKSVDGRKEFLTHQGDYEPLLTGGAALSEKWDVLESGTERQERAKKK